MLNPTRHGKDEQAATEESAGLSAQAFAAVLCEQISVLHDVSIMLEATLAAEVLEAEPLPPESLRSLQRLDFLRQSLKDLEVILKTVSPGLDWKTDYAPDEGELRHAVSMHASVDQIFPQQPSRSADKQDDPEVWL
ncbi:hypothetical protein [Pseudooceanicola nanhaiensis]|uniref:hypothetical protein n=1 Tax=Pseudooceanicola nanhaiensis TaxID=375761 RepID=UPI001CD5E36F|nr:hypothetical protein [Pseudooceanicola nanhaiensis]MCA0921667.1 hypothetical protein [Pseudooceanicola nanhaiensis]